MVRRLPPVVLLFILAACGGSDSSQRGGQTVGDNGAILPVVDTVDGVVVMRHAADALERAPRWTLDSMPSLVIDGGEEVDLSWSDAPLLLSDGRSVVVRRLGAGEVVLFDAEGHPTRRIARTGSGPGELRAPAGPILLAGDTIVVADNANKTVNWYVPDSGLVRTMKLEVRWPLYCYLPTGQLPGGRQVGIGYCSSNVMNPDRTLRSTTPLVSYLPDRSGLDTLRMIPSIETRMVELTLRGHTSTTARNVELGRFPTVTAVDSVVVLATGVGSYVLEFLDAHGSTRARLVVDRRPVLVTPELKRAALEAQYRLIDETPYEAGADLTVIKDEARQAPYADTLPPYRRVLPGADGVFWVVDFISPVDSTWSATAFRLDGTIVGRVSAPLGSDTRRIGPVWFGRDRVMVRQADEDGVVRYGVYRVVKARPALAQGASGGGEG